jgi:hypothetical protein
MTFNGVYGGEDYDARLDEAGWDRMPFPADPANAWKQAVNSAGPGCALRAALQPPVKVREVLTVPEVTNFSAGVYAYDFKSEFSGWPVLRVAGAAGTIVRLTPAELDDGAGGPSAVSGRANIPGGMPDQRLPNFGPGRTHLLEVTRSCTARSFLHTASGTCWLKYWPLRPCRVRQTFDSSAAMGTPLFAATATYGSKILQISLDVTSLHARCASATAALTCKRCRQNMQLPYPMVATSIAQCSQTIRSQGMQRFWASPASSSIRLPQLWLTSRVPTSFSTVFIT